MDAVITISSDSDREEEIKPPPDMVKIMPTKGNVCDGSAQNNKKELINNDSLVEKQSFKLNTECTSSLKKGKNKESSPQNDVGNSNLDLFKKFVEMCTPLLDEKKSPEVILTSIKKQYENADKEFLTSNEFKDRLSRYIRKLKEGNRNIYVFLNDVFTVLKQHKKSRRRVALQTVSTDDVGPSKKIKLPNHSTENGDCSTTKQEKNISRLEKYLERLSSEIKRLQAHELSFEEMDEEDSTYIQEDLLRKKFVKVFNRICELKNVKPKTGRIVEKKIQIQSSRFPEINAKIETYVNKAKFPDLYAVNYLVVQANAKHSLNLTPAQIKEVSRDLFKDVGEKLQQRRHYDFVYNFGCYLTDNETEDPAENDDELSSKLKENRNVAKTALNDVIEKFVHKQRESETAGHSSGQRSSNEDLPKPGSESEPPSDDESSSDVQEVEQEEEEEEIINLDDIDDPKE